jgi:hypothetical protein
MATIEGLYKLVLVDVRKSKVGSLQPADFNIWINKAQRIVVDNKLASMDINTRHQDDLMPLRKKVVLTPELEQIYAALPIDYLRTDAISLTLTKDDVDYDNVSCSYLSSNRFANIMRSHYDKPSLKLCYFNYGIETIDEQDKRVVYVYKPTDATITSINLHYYCEPATIEYSTENKDNVLIWNESMVNEIAQMCSLMYIASIGDPRVQTNMLIKQQTNSKQ